MSSGETCWDHAARGETVRAVYQWTGPLGASTFLCPECCAEWRARRAAAPMSRVRTIPRGGQR